jgi:hypothetical protein
MASETPSIHLTNKLFGLINATTTLEKLELERFKSQKTHVQEYCPFGTRGIKIIFENLVLLYLLSNIRVILLHRFVFSCYTSLLEDKL